VQIVLSRSHLQNRPKWTGGVDQMVECLLLQGQSLRSNPSATKKRQDTGHISLDQCLSKKQQSGVQERIIEKI
jgi:hypothetical protein